MYLEKGSWIKDESKNKSTLRPCKDEHDDDFWCSQVHSNVVVICAILERVV